jgi:hypothetical protein
MNKNMKLATLRLLFIHRISKHHGSMLNRMLYNA